MRQEQQAVQNMTILGHKQINTNMAIYRQNTPSQALEWMIKRLDFESRSFTKTKKQPLKTKENKIGTIFVKK